MPTYDYRCNACEHTFDELQSFSDPPLTKCPKCKKNKLERLFGGGGAIIFKGGGFYETDYRRAGQKSGAAESAPAPESKDTKADAPAPPAAAPAKTETKSESKSGGTKKKEK
jgi:putative FmdB family regulatory protein